MPNKNNVEMLSKIKESLDSSDGLFVVDYRGLSVKESQELRRNLRDTDASMKVYKNNIVRIALKEADMPDLDLSGTCAYVFFQKDPVESAKVIKDCAQKTKKLSFVGGIAYGKALSPEDAKAYADLPGHDELIAQFTHVLASPLRGIASVCAGPARGLATALDAVAKQKEKDAA